MTACLGRSFFPERRFSITNIGLVGFSMTKSDLYPSRPSEVGAGKIFLLLCQGWHCSSLGLPYASLWIEHMGRQKVDSFRYVLITPNDVGRKNPHPGLCFEVDSRCLSAVDASPNRMRLIPKYFTYISIIPIQRSQVGSSSQRITLL